MLKQPIYVEFNLDARTSPSKLIAISHVDDKYSETLEVAVKQNDRFVYMGGATVVARMVLHREKDYLLSDSVPCTINANGNILIPFDNAVVKTLQGVVKIEVNITRDEDELTLQFPLWVSVNGSILDNAEVTPDSEGTIPELLEEAKEALDDATAALEQLGSYDNLADKPQINGVTLSGNQTSEALGLQDKLTAGNNVEIDANGRISAKDTNNYNDLTDKPKFRFNSAISDPVEGTLEWNPYEFKRVGNNINLHANIFRSYLGFNEIQYDFNSMNTHADFYHSGVYKFNKSNISNLPEEFVDAEEFIYVYHYMTSGKDDFIRKVVYETTEGVKAWIQLATLGVTDASGNAPIVSASAWADLTNQVGYTLKPQDKTDIANIVLQELPTTQGVLYGNASN